MLNGIDPIIIFSFFKNIPGIAPGSAIPISQYVDRLALPPIPIYLSERLTGLYVDSEDKNIDIETTTDTLALAGTPSTNQKAINSVLRVNLLANKDSIGLMILSSLADLILPVVTSKEYSIIYLHGATTIFGGLLHSFSVHQDANSTLMQVSIEIVNTSKKTAVPSVEKPPNAASLADAGPTNVPLKSGTGSTPTQVPAGSPPVSVGRLL